MCRLFADSLFYFAEAVNRRRPDDTGAAVLLYAVASANTASMCSLQNAISSSVSVGCTKNIRLVSPSSTAFFSRSLEFYLFLFVSVALIVGYF